MLASSCRCRPGEGARRGWWALHEGLFSNGKAKSSPAGGWVQTTGCLAPWEELAGPVPHRVAQFFRHTHGWTDGQMDVDDKAGLLGKLYVSGTRPAADSAASVQLPELHIKPGSTSKPLFHNPLEVGFSNSAERTRLVVWGPGISPVVNGCLGNGLKNSVVPFPAMRYVILPGTVPGSSRAIMVYLLITQLGN